DALQIYSAQMLSNCCSQSQGKKHFLENPTNLPRAINVSISLSLSYAPSLSLSLSLSLPSPSLSLSRSPGSSLSSLSPLSSLSSLSRFSVFRFILSGCSRQED